MHFQKRSLLSLPSPTVLSPSKSTTNDNNTTATITTTFRLMTYNVLAQSLIRRTMFPHSGKILKWPARSQVLESELQFYAPDLLVMQEVDVQKMDHWRRVVKEMGLQMRWFAEPTKTHGLVIAYRSEWEFVDELKVLLDLVPKDSDPTGASDASNVASDSVDLSSSTTVPTSSELELGLSDTKNVGYALVLRIPLVARDLIIGTTHLYWHPQGSFERARQLCSLSSQLLDFAAAHHPNAPIFLAGDFNSSPEDLPYALLMNMSHPDTETIFDRSIRYISARVQRAEFLNSRSHINTDDEAIKAEVPSLEDLAANVPETIVSQHRSALLASYARLRKRTSISSVYSSYTQVDDSHPVNNTSAPVSSQAPESLFGEPAYSNWTLGWKGLLDYMFYFAPVADETLSSSTFSNSTLVPKVKVSSLLQIPSPKNMDPKGIPQSNLFPSDHLALLAELQIYWPKESN